MKKNIIFSFIIPAHNEGEVISKCLDALINQSHKKNYEIIVVNDGSTDNTLEIAKKYKIRILNFRKGHSAAFSRNKGAELAKGDYIGFIDADQIVEKTFMKKLFDLYNKEKFDITNFSIYAYKPKSIFQKAWSAYRKLHICRGLPIIKKKIFMEFGGFDDKLFYIEDDVFLDLMDSKCKNKSSNIKVYHIDTKDWRGFVRQRKWQGRGLYCRIFKKRQMYAWRFFLPCLLLFFVFFIPLLNYFVFIPLLVYFILSWIYFSIKSKEPINSFLWVTTDYIGRFFSLFYFLKEIFKNKFHN